MKDKQQKQKTKLNIFDFGLVGDSVRSDLIKRYMMT